MRGFMASILLLAAAAAAGARPAAGQEPPLPAEALAGRPIVVVSLQREETPATDATLFTLLETTVGEPLSMADVRESLTHLFNVGRFQGIEVRAEPAGAGVALTYVLTPVHGVSEIRFRGDLGLSEGDLRRVVVDRFGKAPPVGRAAAAARLLEQHYARRGFARAEVRPGIDVRHDPDRTILTFEVQAGPRSRIGRVQVTGVPDPARVAGQLELRPGAAFEEQALEERLAGYLKSLRRRGYYEATADYRLAPREEDTLVDVTVEARPGPRVRLAFAGDPLPSDRVAALVPVEREGTVDEDLLEDSDRRIRDFLLEQGYWKAQASHRREERDGAETITFTVRQGRRYVVDAVRISGNQSVPFEALRPLVPVEAGEPFVEGRLTTAAAAIRAFYLQQGFTAAAVDVATNERGGAEAPGRVAVEIVVREGPRTRVGSIGLDGNTVLTDTALRAVMKVAPGDPYYEPAVAADRDAVLVEYLNHGYAGTTVAVDTPFSADRRTIDLRYRIAEGPQVIVDHVIVVGNTRTSDETIRRELLLQPGKPLGLADVIESQRRLSALGLFRRVRITEAAHGDDQRRDIIVTVEEASRTTLAYGAGIELIPRLGLGAGARAVQRYDLAPRGSFEIGRRNLWGRTRSVNLFTRVSLRPRGESIESPGPSKYGLNEYRVVGTYREIGAFDSNADVAVNAFTEQAIRSTFNFRRQGLTGEVLRRLTPSVRFTGRYSIGRTSLFEARIPQADRLLVDRLFDQVRLSSVTGSIYRDTRDDPLDPARGLLLGSDTELAARSIGSQVGFAKTFVQALWFRTVSRQRHVVVATAARLGLARGFSREVDGQPVTEDLPASERFFAGGSTTVRGFALDRLGAPGTISQTGFAQGGSALLVLNLELRAPVWRDLGMVGFLDAGNVFARVSDFDLSELRVSPGLGLRYRSPIGPIRVDVGFKLRRRELSPGNFEGQTAFQISVGHAF